jgi:hypothetical protein
MPHDTREKANEWCRLDKEKKPEVWKLRIRIQYLQRKLEFINNPIKYQAHLKKNREREQKKRDMSKVVRPRQNYKLESELV